MHISELAAVGVFCSYFSIIAGLFLLIARSLFSQDLGSRAYVFIALAITSFVHTWFYMFKFMAWSFTDYERSTGATIFTGLTVERMSQWLLNTSLFEQAWANVCFGQVNWWWSQQLCLFTVGAWTIFLSIEGRRHNVQFIWAYMLLGQLVAISVASNLFYLALVLAPRPPSPSSNHGLSSLQAPVALWLPVLLSLGTVATSPFTSERSFLPNLLLMHSLIVLPLLAPDRLFPLGQASTQTKSYFGISLKTLYILVFGAALALHTRATGQALGDPAVSVTDFTLKAWNVLHSHPAQSSIGWDVIWTSISFVVWLVLQPELQGRLLTATYLLLATPLVSVGVLAPHVLRPRENEREEKVQ
ncbi:hypothetical protein C8F04DRAFT_120728 [Mycena alexandri]|uniref:Uncharacterized protein n=1 Tax=Mycena alexandri TaxID=1745969 RepID=A0AAD6SDS1_9AGAR|nr:hypothetical protein C8F04DRAFT_120728 [Mycena alexandri]